MLNNPFTPLFGGKPSSYFGRNELRSRFARALQVPGSDDRVLFITGTRGSGKTALLEQFSQEAASAGWSTVDVGSEHALVSLYRSLLPYDDATVTTDPSLEVKVLGSGGSLSGKSISKTTRYTLADLSVLLQEKCAKEKHGLFVSIDEIQKVPIDDVVSICEAFQMASRKGLNIALAVAGLPYSYDAIIHEDGCTFMRRSVHEPLNLLTHTEVAAAFAETFGAIRTLHVNDDAMEKLVSASSGHPYMMQLLGYQLVEYINAKHSTKKPVATLDDVEMIIPAAMRAYEQRSLRPLLHEMSEGERQYLKAMASAANANRISSTADIGSALGKTSQQISGLRKKLIDNGVIVSAGHGEVRFNIPYLRTYVLKPDEEESNLDQLEAWDV